MAGTIPRQTSRFLLRGHVSEDVEILYQFFETNEAMYRCSGRNPYAMPEQARETVKRFIGSDADPCFCGWTIERDGRMIGTIRAYNHGPERNQIYCRLQHRSACWGKDCAAEVLTVNPECLTVQEGMD